MRRFRGQGRQKRLAKAAGGVFCGAVFLLGAGCGGRGTMSRSMPPVDLIRAPHNSRDNIPRAKPPAWDEPEGEFAFLEKRRPRVPDSATAVVAAKSVAEAGPADKESTSGNLEPTSKAGDRLAKCHVVEKGETLWSIGRRYGVPWRRIMAANRFLNPRRLPVGRRLYIPPAGGG